jgi:hypothetical protein
MTAQAELMAKVPVLRAAIRQQILSTCPLDRKLLRKSVETFYSQANWACPDMYFFATPIEAWSAINHYAANLGACLYKHQLYTNDPVLMELDESVSAYLEKSLITPISNLQQPLRELFRQNLPPNFLLSPNFWGTWDRNFASQEFLPYQYDENKKALYHNGCIGWFFKKKVFLVERPTEIHVDANNRLHNLEGPALAWGHLKIYAWKGEIIPPRLIERRWTPNRFSVHWKNIRLEITAAVYNPAWALEAFRAVMISRCDWGGQVAELYNIQGLRFLHLRNGTVEPDGTRKEFLLRVPNNISHASTAVASSYGLSDGAYHEAVRT